MGGGDALAHLRLELRNLPRDKRLRALTCSTNSWCGRGGAVLRLPEVGGAVFIVFRNLPRDHSKDYRGTSLIKNNLSLGPYSRLMPRALWWS